MRGYIVPPGIDTFHPTTSSRPSSIPSVTLYRSYVDSFSRHQLWKFGNFLKIDSTASVSNSQTRVRLQARCQAKENNSWQVHPALTSQIPRKFGNPHLASPQSFVKHHRSLRNNDIQSVMNGSLSSVITPRGRGASGIIGDNPIEWKTTTLQAGVSSVPFSVVWYAHTVIVPGTSEHNHTTALPL